MLDNRTNYDLYSPKERATFLSRTLAIGLLLTACRPSEEAVGSGEGMKGGDTTESSGVTDMKSTGMYDSGPTTGQETGTDTSGEATSSGEANDSTMEPEPKCGNNIVEIGEECEGQDNCFNCYRDRIIFVSSNKVTGAEIVGLNGADDLCLQYAGQAGLPNPLSYEAWLSDSEHDAEDRLFISKAGRYFNTNGELIFIGWKELLSGQLRNPVSYDEYGEPTIGSVWTGTLPNGVGAGNPVNDPKQYCNDWTSDELLLEVARGYIGSALSTDSAWTFYPDAEVNPTFCAIGSSLYCIEGRD